MRGAGGVWCGCLGGVDIEGEVVVPLEGLESGTEVSIWVKSLSTLITSPSFS